ncbi:MAG TPA: hypothetical protein VFN67_31710, partial [Polyangiales bacterium]|nr:hypothetical protein [Polyangiales bacterium]
MSARNQASEPHGVSSAPQRIGDHYEVLAPLGRGGMACVYRVRDLRSGAVVALKQLLAQRHGDKHAREAARLFEREFHTLA